MSGACNLRWSLARGLMLSLDRCMWSGVRVQQCLIPSVKRECVVRQVRVMWSTLPASRRCTPTPRLPPTPPPSGASAAGPRRSSRCVPSPFFPAAPACLQENGSSKWSYALQFLSPLLRGIWTHNRSTCEGLFPDQLVLPVHPEVFNGPRHALISRLVDA